MSQERPFNGGDEPKDFSARKPERKGPHPVDFGISYDAQRTRRQNMEVQHTLLSNQVALALSNVKERTITHDGLVVEDAGDALATDFFLSEMHDDDEINLPRTIVESDCIIPTDPKDYPLLIATMFELTNTTLTEEDFKNIIDKYHAQEAILEDKWIPGTQGIRLIKDAATSQLALQPILNFDTDTVHVSDLYELANTGDKNTTDTIIYNFEAKKAEITGPAYPLVADVMSTKMEIEGRLGNLERELSDLVLLSRYDVPVDYQRKNLPMSHDVIRALLKERDHISREVLDDIKPDMKTFYMLDQESTYGNITQSIMTLVENSWDNHLEEQNAAGKVTVETFRDTEGMLQYVVTDNGSGVPEDMEPVLFEQKQSAKDNKLHFGGYGIGLYLLKTKMQKHGGDLTYNPLPVGSEFTLTFDPQATDFPDELPVTNDPAQAKLNLGMYYQEEIRRMPDVMDYRLRRVLRYGPEDLQNECYEIKTDLKKYRNKQARSRENVPSIDIDISNAHEETHWPGQGGEIFRQDPPQFHREDRDIDGR